VPKDLGRIRRVAKDEEDSCSGCPTVPAQFSSSSSNALAAYDTQQKREICSWFEVHHLVREIAGQLKDSGGKFDCVLGISSGGIIPAKLLAEELGIDSIKLIPVKNKQVVYSDMPRLDKQQKYIVIDDIYDTGATSQNVSVALKGYKFKFAFCLSRYPDCKEISGRILNHDRWIVFPWERETTQIRANS
jgi:hypoxanthine phosphoribosyltransferase